MIKLALLVSLFVVSQGALSTELTIQLNPKYEDGNQTEYSVVKNKSAILGEQGNFGIRKSIEDKVKDYSIGYKERTQQILVHTRARDLFMIAETPDEAYNAYLLMTAAQKCLASKEGVGLSGASAILFKIAQHQIDTEIRRQAVIRSEYMLKRGDFPSLDMEMKNHEYCQFTNQPIIVNKELTEYLNETGS